MSVRLEEKVATEEETLSNLEPAQQLFHYARTGNTNACRDLLKSYPGLVNEVDNGGPGVYATKNTALHFACQFGHLSVVELLHSQTANMEAGNKFNSTPLHIAACHGHEVIVRFLLKMKVNIYAKNIIENTPLHCAIYAGHIGCVGALLEKVDDIKEALLQTPNGVGVSPAKYASSNKMKEFLKTQYSLSKTRSNNKEIIDDEDADELAPDMEDKEERKVEDSSPM